MRIILLQDIDKLGKKDEIKEVADGYARNYLIPQGLAKLASKENLNCLKRKQEALTKKAEEELKRIGELASKIDGQEIELKVKVGEGGQLFEKIRERQILKALKEKGFEADKLQVLLEKPIEELGEFPVKIKFDHNLESEIKVIVVREEEKQATENSSP